MGYSVVFSGDGGPDVFSLATNAGLVALGGWAEDLPPEGFEAVRGLLEDGTVDGTDGLSAQLAAALDRYAPDDPDVRHTAENLLGLLGVGAEGETATITDGEDEDDGDGEDEGDDDEPPGKSRGGAKYNPNHDGRGRFAAGGGGGGGSPPKPPAQRQRDRAQGHPSRARSEGHADLRSAQHEERAELGRDLRAERREHHADQRKERHELKRGQAREGRELERGQARERRGLDKEQASETRRLEKDQAKEKASMERSAARGHHDPSDLAAMHETHASDRASHATSQAHDRAELGKQHEREVRDQDREHADARRDLARSHREDRLAQHPYYRERIGEMVGRHRDEQAELLREGREGTRKALGFKRLASDPDAGPRAHDLLADILEAHGLTESYLRGTLGASQRLAVLRDLRLAARAWLRVEAEKVLAEYGAEDAGKAIFGKAREALAGFFDRARAFVRESIVAGALALGGPAPPPPPVTHALDRQIAGQHAYLEKFRAEVLDGPTPVDPSFVARAEMYGGPVWSAPMNAAREASVGAGVATHESRHHRGHDEPCEACVAEQARGVVPIGTLRPIGDSPCMCHCHCIFLYFDVDGNEVNPLDG